MKRKKNLFIGILCSIFMLGNMQAMPVKAAAAPVLSAAADKAGVQDGDSVNISVSLRNNPGIVTWNAVLNYDNSTLKYMSSSWSGGFSSNDINAATDTGSSVNLSAVCSDSYTSDGTIVTVRFEAVRSASTIPVTLGLGEMTDIAMDPISNCQVSSAVSLPQSGGTSGNTDVEGSGNNSGSGAIGTDDPGNDDTQIDDAEADDTEIDDDTETDDTEQGSVQIGNVDNDGTTGQGGAGGTGNMAQNTRTTVSTRSIQAGHTASSSTGNKGTDESYKTGVNLGNDKYILLAAVCGILAMALLCRKGRKITESDKLDD